MGLVTGSRKRFPTPRRCARASRRLCRTAAIMAASSSRPAARLSDAHTAGPAAIRQAAGSPLRGPRRRAPGSVRLQLIGRARLIAWLRPGSEPLSRSAPRVPAAERTGLRFPLGLDQVGTSRRQIIRQRGFLLIQGEGCGNGDRKQPRLEGSDGSRRSRRAPRRRPKGGRPPRGVKKHRRLRFSTIVAPAATAAAKNRSGSTADAQIGQPGNLGAAA